MADFKHQPLFELGPDPTVYRKLSTEHVSTVKAGDVEILKVDGKALSMLAAAAVRDVSHLFRTGHLEQLRKILDDPEASRNDRFVATQMLRNANVYGGEVPEEMLQAALLSVRALMQHVGYSPS